MEHEPMLFAQQTQASKQASKQASSPHLAQLHHLVYRQHFIELRNVLVCTCASREQPVHMRSEQNQQQSQERNNSPSVMMTSSSIEYTARMPWPCTAISSFSLLRFAAMSFSLSAHCSSPCRTSSKSIHQQSQLLASAHSAARTLNSVVLLSSSSSSCSSCRTSAASADVFCQQQTIAHATQAQVQAQFFRRTTTTTQTTTSAHHALHHAHVHTSSASLSCASPCAVCWCTPSMPRRNSCTYDDMPPLRRPAPPL